MNLICLRSALSFRLHDDDGDHGNGDDDDGSDNDDDGDDS